ncbi:MAG TPA: AAA family ATPase, partial [Thermoleophilia bacterium]|nr:AAA family ATPase [Thermoleophilia bacterium]
MSTRLVGLSVQRFRNLPEFAVEFDSGFVIVRGPNEAGKSSLVEAVFFGLFRDAGSTAREISQAITWGLSSRPVIDLTFEADGDEYFLRRDYAAKKNLLRNTTTRDEWHDKKTIAAKVAELIGLETESLVRSTICVRAAELQRVSEAGDDLRVLLEQQVSGVGDVDLGAIGERLEKEIREIRPPRKRDVGLWRAEDEAAEARAVCDEVSQALQEQALLSADYYRGQRDLPALQSLLVEKKKSLERARAYLSIEERHETAEAVLDKALERLQSRQNAQQQRAQAATELERLAPALEAAECEVEAEAKTESERVLLGGRLEQAEKNLASLEQAVADARHAESELGAALSAIEELGAVPVQGELQRLLRLQTTILTYGDLLAAHQASVEVTAKRAVVVHIGQQRHELDRGQGVSAEVIGDLTLDIGNVAEVRVTAGGDDLKCTASDCAAMRDELERTLSGLAAGSLAELEQRVTRASELRGARRRASERLADVVGDGTVDDLAKRVDVARAGTEGLRSQLDASLADLRADARSRRNELRRALDEQTIRLNHAEGLLSGLPDEEELKREQREAAKEALKAEEGLKEHRPYELSADELGRLESEVAALDERERRLQINLGIWEGRLDGRYEATDLDAAGEALATA